MSKEGKAKGIHGKMPLYSIGRFIETVAFRLNTRIASILHRLRIDDDQGCPFWLFLPVVVLVHVRPSSVSQMLLPLATVCSANRQWSREGSLWASRTSYIRF